MLGLIDLAENIRPHGLTCYTQKKCKADIEKFSDIVSKVVNGPLKRATEIQKKADDPILCHRHSAVHAIL